MICRELLIGVGIVVATGCSAGGSTAGSHSQLGSAASAGLDMDPGIDTNNGNAGGSSSNDQTCAITSAAPTLIKQPVDIILVLDNSGSMADELEAVEKNINVNFANILEQSGVDYRVILISRHRKGVRGTSGETSTSICVTQPLSGLAVCPGPKPVNSARFFQYSLQVMSDNSFDDILSTYNARDPNFALTLVGWSEWLRPGAKKVFLELTDDDALLPVDTFLQKLTQLAPAHFGSDPAHPTFVFHSIVGVQEKAPPTAPYLPAEPIQVAKCAGGGDKVTNAGLAYQDLSKRTGGLRFPICEFASYDTVFTTIANDVVVKAQLSCDFDIPASPVGQELDPTKVAVQYTKGGAGAVTEFGQAQSAGVCEPNAFYIQNNHIYLCPDTCATVQADGAAKVDVLFTCKSTIIVK